MATMVKEKRREKKKKTKDKSTPNMPNVSEEPLASSSTCAEDNISNTEEKINDDTKENLCLVKDTTKVEEPVELNDNVLETDFRENIISGSNSDMIDEAKIITESNSNISDYDFNYTDLKRKLDIINISYETTDSINLSNLDFESSLEDTNSIYDTIAPLHCNSVITDAAEENVFPSAPVFEEIPNYQEEPPLQVVVQENEHQIKSMPLEEAVRLFGGAEMNEVRELSLREEALVEAGPACDPEHPLIDLLSNFKCSLRALDRQRAALAAEFAAEEAGREARAWRVERRRAAAAGRCGCGVAVTASLEYDHAELRHDSLPAAYMQLQGLVSEVQDSFCHHQHTALLTHCQIEELVCEYVSVSDASEQRTALALVLQALHGADEAGGAAEAGARALRRWAEALARPLLASGDLRHLLFILHHMRRQRRSVRWVSRLVRGPRGARGDLARAVALLAELLTLRDPHAGVDPASEAIDDSEETWEELDRSGGGGAVCAGAMRERDLLSLFDALSADIVERLVLGESAERVESAGEERRPGGLQVARAWCGARVLTWVCAGAGAGSALPRRYSALRRRSLALALDAVAAVADLHLHARSEYSESLAATIESVIEPTLAELWAAVRRAGAGAGAARMPWRAAGEGAALRYCREIIDTYTERGCASAECGAVCGAECGSTATVTAAARIATERPQQPQVGLMVLRFLFNLGLSSGRSPGGGGSGACAGCAGAARGLVGRVLAAHPDLYITAFYMFADLCAADKSAVSLMPWLHAAWWRVPLGAWPAARDLLDHLRRRASPALPALLLAIDTTPHTGVELEVQLHIGRWLGRCADAEWAWRALRRLRLHRAHWHGHAGAVTCALPHPETGAPAMDKEETAATALFRDVYNLLATSWGHEVPLICSSGAAALQRVARASRRDCAHCLHGALLAMAPAPDSIALTPQLISVVRTMLQSGPSLVQRALGRGGDSGAAMLLRLMLAQLTDCTLSASMEPDAVWSVWLHTLWQCGAEGGGALLEAGALGATASGAPSARGRRRAVLLAHARAAMQEPYGPAAAEKLLREAGTCPSVACAILTATHEMHVYSGTWPRLLHALHVQRVNNQAPHVDNALKSIDGNIPSSSLAILRIPTALLSSPAASTAPALVPLWTFFFHLYLERPPHLPQDTTAPIGPLFFSGFMKYRELNALKTRLALSVKCHRTEIDKLKGELQTASEQTHTDHETTELEPNPDTDLLPQLSLADLTGEPHDTTDSSDSETEGAKETTEQEGEMSERDRLLRDRITYHSAAENMLKTYLGWLEEGDKVHATIYSVPPIPEHALDAACKAGLSRLLPPPSPDDVEVPPPPLPPPPPPPPQPFQRLQRRLNNSRRDRRRREQSAAPPRPPRPPADPRTLLAVFDKHLRTLQEFAKWWESSTCHIGALDTALWALVRRVRVRRAVANVRRACANHCAPLALQVDAYEWCVDLAVRADIQDNRARAHKAIRQLAKPRPDFAKTAAALQSLAKSVGDVETAKRVLQRCWECAGSAGGVERCAPAAAALTAVYTDLAERVVSGSGEATLALVGEWRGALSGLQRALSARLLRPRLLPSRARTLLYCAVLRAPLTPHCAFTCLSKFEMCRWSASMPLEDRRVLLDAVTEQIVRHGPDPHPDDMILLELLGVHTRSLTQAQTVRAVATQCARAAAAAALLPAHWVHVQRALDDHASTLTLDELGHTMRELGEIWWEARRSQHAPHGTHVTHASLAPHVAHVARMLRTLLVAFVSAAQDLRYDVQRVAWYGWSGLEAAWGAWVTGGALPPAEQRLARQHFCRDLLWLREVTAGAEPYLLQEVYLWSQQLPTEATAAGGGGELLEELAALPWTEYQWFSPRCMPALLNVCAGEGGLGGGCEGWRERWAARVLAGTVARSWCAGVPEDQLPGHLQSLFHIFTTLPFDSQCLEEACGISWRHLPKAALEVALERFLSARYDVTRPLSRLPCFRLVLFASELLVRARGPSGGHGAESAEARSKRRAAVCWWMRTVSLPALQAHVARALECFFDTLTDAESPMTGDEAALSEVLSDAVTVLCTEPAALRALPAWLKWVGNAAGGTAGGAVVTALGALPALDTGPLLALADRAVCDFLNTHESGWAGVFSRWAAGPRRAEAPDAARRGALHAAYALSAAFTAAPAPGNVPPLSDVALAAVFHAVANTTVNFVEHEAILCVWVCFACRVCGGGSEAGSGGEVLAAAGALLRSWGEERRRSLLRAITMSTGDVPTDRLRLLCRLAQCVVEPGRAETARGGAALHAALLGAAPAADWGRGARARELPRLARTLLPNYHRYFQFEYDLTPPDDYTNEH